MKRWNYVSFLQPWDILRGRSTIFFFCALVHRFISRHIFPGHHSSLKLNYFYSLKGYIQSKNGRVPQDKTTKAPSQPCHHTLPGARLHTATSTITMAVPGGAQGGASFECSLTGQVLAGQFRPLYDRLLGLCEHAAHSKMFEHELKFSPAGT